MGVELLGRVVETQPRVMAAGPQAAQVAEVQWAVAMPPRAVAMPPRVAELSASLDPRALTWPAMPPSWHPHPRVSRTVQRGAGGRRRRLWPDSSSSAEQASVSRVRRLGPWPPPVQRGATGQLLATLRRSSSSSCERGCDRAPQLPVVMAGGLGPFWPSQWPWCVLAHQREPCRRAPHWPWGPLPWVQRSVQPARLFGWLVAAARDLDHSPRVAARSWRVVDGHCRRHQGEEEVCRVCRKNDEPLDKKAG